MDSSNPIPFFTKPNCPRFKTNTGSHLWPIYLTKKPTKPSLGKSKKKKKRKRSACWHTSTQLPLKTQTHLINPPFSNGISNLGFLNFLAIVAPISILKAPNTVGRFNPLGQAQAQAQAQVGGPVCLGSHEQRQRRRGEWQGGEAVGWKVRGECDWRGGAVHWVDIFR